jgi:hypothetical protein
MNRKLLYITLSLLIPLLFACEKEEEPITMSFEELFGREGWKIEDTSSFPEGFFSISKSSDVSVTEEGTPETGLTYSLTTSGTEPQITSHRLTSPLSLNYVLSFKYKSSETISPALSLDIYKPAAFSKMFDMPAASEWTDYEFDLGNLISTVGWGELGAYFRIYMGDKSGVTVDIKELQVRSRTPEENDAINAFYFDFNENFNYAARLSEFTNVTEVNTYNGVTYKYVVKPGHKDPWVRTMPRSRALAEDEVFLSFEYKCAVESNFQLFLKIAGGGFIGTFEIPASEEWTSVTYDLREAPNTNLASVLAKHADALNAGHPMRWDINNVGGVDMLFRNVRIHK